MVVAILSLFAALGAWVGPSPLHRVPKYGHSRRVGSVGVVRSSQRLGLVAICAGCALTFGVVAGLVALGAGVLLARLMVASRKRRLRQTTAEEVPDVVLLLAVGLLAGTPLSSLIERLAGEIKGTCRDELARAVERHRLGQPLIEALADSVSPSGLGPVVPLLRSQVQDGAAIAEPLLDIAAAARADRRRSAEAQARRLPVRMLLPLIVFVLPGFLLLTVAPVIIESLRSVQL